MTEIEGFRGLAHVVEVWRAINRDDKPSEYGEIPGRLIDVLNMADEYMSDVERQEPVNTEGGMQGWWRDKPDDEVRAAVANIVDTQSVPTPPGNEVTMKPESRWCTMATRHEPHTWNWFGQTTVYACAGFPPTVERTDGMYRKYVVARTDGTDHPGGKHDGCPYFVLDLRHDPAARIAGRRYSQVVAQDEPRLSEDLAQVILHESYRAHGEVSADAERTAHHIPAQREPDLSPLNLLPEVPCTVKDPHHGHEYTTSDGTTPTADADWVKVWCPGVKGGGRPHMAF